MKQEEELQDQINKRITEFMGGPYEGDSAYCGGSNGKLIPEIENQIKAHFSTSLDALVPVVEKLKAKFEISHSEIDCKPGLDDFFKPKYYCNLQHDVGHYYGDHTYKPWRVFKEGKSPSEALAMAVYEVLENNNVHGRCDRGLE